MLYEIDSQKTYSIEELHPEGEFIATIKVAKETPKFIIVEFETNAGTLTKFYKFSTKNDKILVDSSIKYLLKAIGVQQNNFDLFDLVEKKVKITTLHRSNDSSDEIFVNISRIESI